MMYRRTINSVLLFASAALFLVACSSSGTSNVILDTVAPTSQIVVAGTVASFSSTVTGATVTTSKWTCSYSYTPPATTTTPSPKAVTGTCTSGMSLNGGTIGTWTTTDTASPNVLVFTAPPLTTFPNPIPVLTFTATPDANPSAKCTTSCTATVALDTGIRVSVTPPAATVPVGVTPAQTALFTPHFVNGPATNVQWLLTQPDSSSTTVANQTVNPSGADCSATCGKIDSNGVYTAPATLPTDTTPPGSKSTSPTTVFVVVNSKDDLNHYAVATITLINSSTNPITFQGMTPTVAAAGGILQDIFLNAHNLLNTTTVTFTDPNGFPTVLPPTQVFTIPISAAYCTPSAASVTPVVTCDASIMTRVRLNQAQLTVPGTATIRVDGLTGGTANLSPGCTSSTAGGASSVTCPLNLVYASPAMVSAVPDSFPQNTAGGVQFSADGGFYGTGVNLLFNGGGLISPTSGPRQFTGQLPNSQLQSPGLYPVSIESNAPIANLPPFNPPPFPTVTTNVAVQPNFSDVNSIYNPTPTTPVFPPSIPLSAGPNLTPSSMAIDSNKGYAVITDQAANAIQIITLPSNGTGVPVVNAPIPLGNQPTSIAIDEQISLSAPYSGDDLGVVVSSGDNSLRLVALTPTSAIPITSIDLTGLITQTGVGTTTPAPYSVGVDPSTHRAVVAYSNSVVGFIVDINPNTDGSDKTVCFPTSIAQKPPCVIASVSLNTGPTPQVVMQPQAPLAYVTPGGSGVTSVVNLELTNVTSAIASASAAPAGAIRNNNLVTITTTVPNGINPSQGGTVLIAGVTPADFNGSYQVTPGSITNFSFTYTQNGANESGGGGTVLYGSPYYTFSTTSTASGAAINPVTRTFAYADYNATSSSQIGFISTLDQSLSTLSLSAGSCQNNCNPDPAGAPEGGFRSVAFDPFTNVLVAYDPSENTGSDFPGNAISLINPGSLSTAGTLTPYRIVQAIKTGQPGTGSYIPSGATAPVSVFGPMGYDPKTNLVLVANAGNNTLTYLNLNPSKSFKKLNVGSVQVTQGGVASSQPPLGSPPATCDLSDPTGAHACLPQGVSVGQTAVVRVLGQGFGGSSSGAQVRLDGSTNGVTTTYVSDSEIDATVSASTLTVPHVYALDVLAAGVSSNVTNLNAVVVKDLGLKPAPVCDALAAVGTSPNLLGQGPEGVAIDTLRHVAIVTNFSCASISIINLDTTGTLYAGRVYGDILKTFAVGNLPIGVDVIPRLGYAVVSNNADNTASIVDISDPLNPKLAVATNVAVGISPTGVTIDQDRALALVANTGSNTLSSIDLTVLLPTSVTTTTPTAATVALSGPPKAIAVDPNRGVAVVTNLLNSGTASASGGLDVVSIASVPPAKNSSTSVNGLTANPTGITYDPAATPAALFYVCSTQQNAVYTFNPDTTITSQIRVGVNPYSLAYNFQTGTMLTLNTTSNTMSIVDTLDFHTTETFGITSQSQFASAMDNFTNTAVIVDQNNNRVLIIAMPK